ncbi:MAG: hypothetical protein RR273_05620 [Oscillospiraceae bacterium]
MEYAPMIIDGILLGIILLSAIKAYSNGFFASGVTLVGDIAGVIIAWFVSKKYSGVLFNYFFRDNLVDQTFEYIQNSTKAIDLQAMAQGVIGKLPQELLQEFISKAQAVVQDITTPTIETASALVDALLGPIIITFIAAAMFVIIIMLCKLVTVMLANLLKIVNHIPVLGFANRLAGFFVGIGIGGVNIILISFLLSIIAIITGNSIELFNSSVLAQSKILAMTRGINPFLI